MTYLLALASVLATLVAIPIGLFAMIVSVSLLGVIREFFTD